MNRKSYIEFLDNWKQSKRRKPLIIRGARQVGKTFLVETWGKRAFKNIISINFEKQIDYIELFELENLEKIITRLELEHSIKLIGNSESFLFLDEIQFMPKVLQLLRYFYEDYPEIPVVCTGSLLDFELDDFSYSMPVGRVTFLNMYPLTFLEFVEAIRGEDYKNMLQTLNWNNRPDSFTHQKLLELLSLYYFVGGMPEAVACYTETKDLLEVRKIQLDIIETLKADFGKYGARKHQQLLQRCFLHAAENIGRKIKYSHISREKRSSFVEEVLALLEKARLIKRVYHSGCNRIPLNAEINRKHFKVIFLDVGLVSAANGLNVLPDPDLMTALDGVLAEQFVGQEILANNTRIPDPGLFYWHREAKSSNAEVDYVIQVDQNIIPIEVKSGSSGKLTALKLFREEKQAAQIIRVHANLMENPSEENNQITSIPLYMSSRIAEFLNVN